MVGVIPKASVCLEKSITIQLVVVGVVFHKKGGEEKSRFYIVLVGFVDSKVLNAVVVSVILRNFRF